jgi:hypothetical protein
MALSYRCNLFSTGLRFGSKILLKSYNLLSFESKLSTVNGSTKKDWVIVQFSNRKSLWRTIPWCKGWKHIELDLHWFCCKEANLVSMVETRIITSQFDLRALNVTELTELKIGEIRCTRLDRSSQTQSDLSHKFGYAFKMISRRMKNIQHTKLETHGG